ncbi:protein 5NUC [Nilaparvata lugens]|uniref:protein 5NUC n=1 Tax=Nilaparvata lugens TaxID=108931 RepID=UPI00193DEF03|nr:protein 5NUC [Nilaparvata lugens]
MYRASKLALFMLPFLTACFVESVSGDLKLLILHNNDMHSHIEEVSQTSGRCKEPGKCFGGFARVSATVSEIRRSMAGKRHVLFMNAGDTFQGTPYYSIFKWKIIAQFIDSMGLDVMCLGNHEFDDGPEGLAPFLARVSTISVACNLNITLEPDLDVPSLRPSIVKIINGTKVGIIGYLTPDTQHMHNTGKVIFLDEIESINRESARLKTEGVNIIIALGHSGYYMDQKIAANCPDVDVVVGGHTNTFLFTGDAPDIEVPINTYPKIVTQRSGKNVAVVQAYAFTKYLGHLMVDFDNDGEPVAFSGNPILLNSSYPEDSKILATLEHYKEQVDKRTSGVIGVTKVLLSNAHKECKLGECNIGNMIADSMVDYNVNKSQSIKSEGWTEAPIAIIQGGGIRGSINSTAEKGNITYGDIMQILPFDDLLLRVHVYGRILKQIFEFAVHRYEQTKVQQVGEFLSVSGVKVFYDVTKPIGQRVILLKVRCGNCTVPVYENVDDNKIYGIVVTDYLANGGDKYEIIKDNIISLHPLGITDHEALHIYINKKSPIYPGLEGRITVISSNHTESGSEALKPSYAFFFVIFIVYQFIQSAAGSSITFS